MVLRKFTLRMLSSIRKVTKYSFVFLRLFCLTRGEYSGVKRELLLFSKLATLMKGRNLLEICRNIVYTRSEKSSCNVIHQSSIPIKLNNAVGVSLTLYNKYEYIVYVYDMHLISLCLTLVWYAIYLFLDLIKLIPDEGSSGVNLLSIPPPPFH